uniref:MEMO1 family protein BECKLFY1418B_GA0070995_106610 n=1 Tax=Candidatus Kentrum sp. LFY TaxID=2126342 RepID=A0A450URT2_9GAMM|nr:MAG: hypothetical protein BECKLFY1418B_GA0070995_106610 [Candidatus Kentron sp. LFY]
MMNAAIRPPAVASLFYPDDPVALKDMVGGFLREVTEKEGKSDVVSKAMPKAIIAPHAGFIYSGPIAASAYGTVARTRPDGKTKRVILLGPSHRVWFQGIAAPSAAFFGTPLGDVPVDREAIAAIADLPQVAILDEAHAAEHSLEVHLPFLREVLGDFMLVPLVVGETRPKEVAEVLERFWDDERGDSDTLIVVSTDLSHYLAYDQARKRDDITARAVETLDVTAIDPEDACGRNPVNGLLYVAKRRGLTVKRLDLRNSGDTAGDKKRVVGYGAWAFFEPEAQP